jgi:2-dehydro-3-deoxy-D-gluconate 5-dehydrogenase
LWARSKTWAGGFTAFRADLADLDPPGLVDETVATFGRVDILVNNAGIIRRQPALEFTRENWDEVVNLNLRPVLSRPGGGKRFVAQQSGGKIINIASMLSFQGGILVPSYTASKSGVMGLTRELACEWAQHNINVNAIAPGYMATENTRALQQDPVRSVDIMKRIPAGRWGSPAISPERWSFLPPAPPIMCTAIPWRSMAAGWHDRSGRKTP